jgi:hypothetical protein
VWDPDTGSPPFVFAGGPSATSNTEPFADFFDFYCLGDGEEVRLDTESHSSCHNSTLFLLLLCHILFVVSILSKAKHCCFLATSLVLFIWFSVPCFRVFRVLLKFFSYAFM